MDSTVSDGWIHKAPHREATGQSKSALRKAPLQSREILHRGSRTSLAGHIIVGEHKVHCAATESVVYVKSKLNNQYHNQRAEHSQEHEHITDYGYTAETIVF